MNTDGISVNLQDLIKLRHVAVGIELAPQRQVGGQLVGEHHSFIQGRGMDFDEFRAYSPGDDVRRIDWHVTAKNNKPYIRVYKEEKQRPIFVLLDQGKSMQFGTKVAFKSVIAAKLAAILAWATLQNNDRIGGFIFGGKTIAEVPAMSGKRGVLKLLHAIASYNVEEKNDDFKTTLLHLRQVIKPGSLVIIISDFQSLNEKLEKQMSYISNRCEMLAIQVNDPVETILPQGNYTFSDGKDRIAINTRIKKVSRHFHQEFIENYYRFQHYCNQHRIKLLSVLTNDDIRQYLKKFFANQATKTRWAEYAK